MCFDHQTYDSTLLTVSTIAELLILYLVWKEGMQVVKDVRETREAATGPFYGVTDELTVGTPVYVIEPQPGVPREKWNFSQAIWIIREIDKSRNWALATPRLPPPQGPMPTVSGQMNGPHSPFRRASVAS